jgi:hypothetical protein
MAKIHQDRLWVETLLYYLLVEHPSTSYQTSPNLGYFSNKQICYEGLENTTHEKYKEDC